MKILIDGSDANSLVLALEMKEAGHDVEVLEGSQPGGVSSLLPGSPLAPAVAAKLDLGITLQIVGRHGVSSEGKNVGLKLREISGDVSERDKTRWREFVTLMNNASEILRGLQGPGPGADVVGRWREFGRRQSLEVMRLPWQSLKELLDFWFESDLLKATLAGAALKGARQGVLAPGSMFLLLQRWAQGEIFGRAKTELSALKSLAQNAGVEFRADSLTSYKVQLGAIESAECTSGESLKADVFVSSADPGRCLRQQVGETLVDPDHLASARHWHSRSTTVVAQLEPSDKWNGAWVNFCDDLESLERAYDPTKYGEFSENLFAEFDSASGYLYVQHLDGDEAKDRVAKFCEERELGAVKKLWTPTDISSEFGATGGHLFGGEKMLWQYLSLRDNLRNPMPNLYLCGASTGPGDYSGFAGLMCRPALSECSAV